MNLMKKIICLFISVSLAASLCSCAKEETSVKDKTKNTSSVKESTSSEDTSSTEEEPSSAEEESSSAENATKNVKTSASEKKTSSHRAEYVPEVEKTFTDTDGKFDYKTVKWAGPAGYKIVVPVGDDTTRKTAVILQNYFKQKLNITVDIEEDSVSATSKEILIGKTNRSESKETLAQNQMNVAVKGEKLVFNGGHSVTLKSAVEKFVRLAPKKNQAYTFKITTDFNATVLGNYKYVWGDEFEGDTLDLKTWEFDPNAMVGTDMVELSHAKDIADVGDGRLKLHARRCFNPKKQSSQFRVTEALETSNTMNWLYGYAEIRARVPFLRGAWPGFWACSAGTVSGIKHKNIIAEVDIFEVFGSTDKLQSNIHKHTSGKGTSQLNSYGTWNEKTAFTFENSKDLKNTYHTYGMRWTPTEIAMSVDGKEYVTVDITKSYDNNSDMTMFNMPMDIIFTNYVMTEDTDMKTNYITDSISQLPACFYIDYIRLYQREGEGKIWTKESNKTYSDR